MTEALPNGADRYSEAQLGHWAVLQDCLAVCRDRPGEDPVFRLADTYIARNLELCELANGSAYIRGFKGATLAIVGTSLEELEVLRVKRKFGWARVADEIRREIDAGRTGLFSLLIPVLAKSGEGGMEEPPEIACLAERHRQRVDACLKGCEPG